MTAHELANHLLALPDYEVRITALYGASYRDVSTEDIGIDEDKKEIVIETDICTG